MIHEPITLDPDEFRVDNTGEDTVSLQARPYATHRVLNCKERWRNKPLFEIFKVEFAKNFDYVENACRVGNILINENLCFPETIVNNGDVIRHIWTSEEPEFRVSKNQLPCIIFKAPGIVVAFKPHSLPTTPQGLFFRTNLVHIVKQYLGLSHVQPVNRLDRAVAGLVILTTNPQVQVEVVEKKYIAQTQSDFPLNVTESRAKLFVEKHVPNQVLRTVFDEEKGVESCTFFRSISAKNRYVECQPETGRTHQIRVHLSGLGCPILGDSLYDHSEKALEKQPEKIHLFALKYSFKIEGEIFTVFCENDFFSDWLAELDYS